MNIFETLRASCFSEEFVKAFKRIWSEEALESFTPEFLLLDEPNVTRYVLEDFVEHSDASKMLTQLNIDALRGVNIQDVESMLEKMLFTPGPGIFRHEERSLYLCVEAQEVSKGDDLRRTAKTTTLVALVSLKNNEVIEYTQHLKKKKNHGNFLKIFTPCNGQWVPNNYPKRLEDTLFLGKLWKDIYQDVQEFLTPESKEWYHKHGIMYRRNYLFSGPPGNGKSSAVKVLASMLDRKLYTINLASRTLDDDLLMDLSHTISSGSILLLEDIDNIFTNHNENAVGSGVTYEFFINLLDGVFSREGLIIIMTCNEEEKLDKTMMRHSRVDQIFRFSNASKKTAKSMCEWFRPEASEEQKKVLTDTMSKAREVPMSAITEFFVSKRKVSLEDALKSLKPDDLKRRKRDSYGVE